MEAIKQFLRRQGITGYIILIAGSMFVVSLLVLGIAGVKGYNAFYEQMTLPLDYGRFIRQPWSLLTWWTQVPPIFFLSLIFDLLFIWSFSNIYRMFLGERRTRNYTLFLLLASGIIVLIIGGAIQAGTAGDRLLGQTPQLYGLDVLVVGLVAAVITFRPEFPVNVFIFGMVKVVWVGLFIIGLSLIAFRGPFTLAGISVIVAGGIGFWQGMSLRSGNDLTSGLGNLLDRKPKAKRPPKPPMKPKFEVVKSPSSPDEDEINRILDKINHVGYEGLTRQEKETLARYSQEK